MLVMGIDSSITATGYCLLDKETNKIIKSGIIRTKYKKNATIEYVIERIIYIANEIINIYREYEPQQVNIEDLSVSRNIDTTKKLSGLLFYLLVKLYNQDANILVLKPAQWRANKIKGRCRSIQKENAKKYVKEHYNIDVTDDEAESIVIAEYE